MPSLKDLRVRIASVKSTQKITKAMQMVAAAKLRRAQEAAESSRPYSDRMARIMASVMANIPSLDNAPPLLVGTGRDERHLLVAMTAERGLCGAFNSNVVRAVRTQVRELREAGKQVQILCVGRKGYDGLKRELGDLIIETISLREVRQIGFANAAEISEKIIAWFADDAFDVCTLYYNSFISVMTQRLTAQQIVPLGQGEGGDDAQAADLGGGIYEFEPEEEDLLADLVPRNISVQIFKALLENVAAENASRMTAMDSATRNAGEMIDSLTLSYNRTRQAHITKELIEIVSGAEAL